MNIDWSTIRAQLVPGWSPVNIVITVLLFLWFWPLGLAMVGYIVKGADFGLDLGRPGTFVPFFREAGDRLRLWLNRLTQSSKTSSDGANTSTSSAGGVPDSDRAEFERWRQDETERLKRERAELEQDKARFASKQQQVENTD